MGGYESLLVYRLSVTIHDLTVVFCSRFLSRYEYKRTVEQMVQAARSGKQNLVEGSLEKSAEMNIKLTGVARASFGELLEDYRDFLRQNGLKLWMLTDQRVVRMREFKENISEETSIKSLSNWTGLNLENSENFANVMICLLFKENYLVDQLLRSMEDKFVKEGGFRENLFKKRLNYKKLTTNYSN